MRCVTRLEERGGRGMVCGGRGGGENERDGVWEGVKCVGGEGWI